MYKVKGHLAMLGANVMWRLARYHKQSQVSGMTEGSSANDKVPSCTQAVKTEKQIRLVCPDLPS